jgi:hypothetical protein
VQSESRRILNQATCGRCPWPGLPSDTRRKLARRFSFASDRRSSAWRGRATSRQLSVPGSNLEEITDSFMFKNYAWEAVSSSDSAAALQNRVPHHSGVRTQSQAAESQRLIRGRDRASNRNGAARTLRAQKQLTRTRMARRHGTLSCLAHRPIRRTKTSLKAKGEKGRME